MTPRQSLNPGNVMPHCLYSKEGGGTQDPHSHSSPLTHLSEEYTQQNGANGASSPSVQHRAAGTVVLVIQSMDRSNIDKHNMKYQNPVTSIGIHSMQEL